MINHEELGGAMVDLLTWILWKLGRYSDKVLFFTTGLARITTCPPILFAVDTINFPHITVADAQLLRNFAEAYRVILIY